MLVIICAKYGKNPSRYKDPERARHDVQCFSSFYPLAIGYYLALRRPSRPFYHSTAHNIQWILLIFGTHIDLSRSMNPLIMGSRCSFLGFCATLKFYEYTDWCHGFAIITDLQPTTVNKSN